MPDKTRKTLAAIAQEQRTEDDLQHDLHHKQPHKNTTDYGHKTIWLNKVCIVCRFILNFNTKKVFLKILLVAIVAFDSYVCSLGRLQAQ